MRSPLWRDVRGTLGAVLARPARLRRLLELGPHGLLRLGRFLTFVVPSASRRLRHIRARAATIPDERLREQALASIDNKAYHVQGGCILATFLGRAAARRYVAAVAPLETIYDYLDNLCDRLPEVPGRAYPTLHEALLDAVDPARRPGDYYRDGPHRDDGGYLRYLVETSREALRALPQIAAVHDELTKAVRYYADLQTFKHFPAAQREGLCRGWYERNEAEFPGLYWWEFAAACGSSMPVFAMLFLAAQPSLERANVTETFDAYFPHLSAVHILLDYFIDQAEDGAHGELNFVACYSTKAEAVARLSHLIEQTAQRLTPLPHHDRHTWVLRVMCLFYLNHPKVFEQRLDAESSTILAAL